MHIKEIVVDGFKSYAHRTVIAGFDPHFNAITGLNGSGKSNILDAICFVLGITNLSQVRAGNLSELVYKQGQAGINRASVTIIFDNRDPSSSPVGYEQCPEVTVTRQVLIGGKSKYLINGRNSPANQVGNLFHSVQLNVNNPHFLIMQGRITKVLNMKPHEILGMVEEAAGTRMYETKRIAALKTIEKKQKKVNEFNAILTEDISPTLEKLRQEKAHYLQWSKNNAIIEKMERFVVASQYVKSQNVLQKSEKHVTDMEEKMTAQQDIIHACAQDVSAKEEEINALETQLNGEYGKAFKKMKGHEEQLSKDLVQATSAWQHSVRTVQTSREDLEAAEMLASDTKKVAQSKQSEVRDDSTRIKHAQAKADEAEEALGRLTKEYQNMCAGMMMSSEENADGGGGGGDESTMTLPNQISKAHNDANAADARAKQAGMKIKHLKKSIKTVEKDMKKEEKSSASLAKKREKTFFKMQALKAKVNSISFSPEEYNQLETEKLDLENSIGHLQETVDTLSARLQGRLAFNYSDPVRGFDRSKVKGIVARLVTVKESKHATALEVVAGGKLFQVVVDEAITGKALLSNGRLQRRVTIIPLDKIRAKRIRHDNVEKARSMAQQMNSTASPAIELVGFDEEVRNALEYVFGSTLVVESTDAANRICDATRTRTVTLDGDVYDPSGTISGGSKNNLGTTLASLSELTAASSQLSEQKGRLSIVSERLHELNASSKKYDDASASLELCETELASIEKHLSQTSYGMLLEQFKSMKQEIEEAETEVEEMEKEKEVKWDLYNGLKEKEAEHTRNREARLKDVEGRMKQAKQIATQTANEARKIETQSQTLSLELESLQAEVCASEEAVKAAKRALNDANEAEADLQMKVGEIKARYDEAKSELDKIGAEMSSCSSELNKLKSEKASILKKSESARLEEKKISVKMAKHKKDTANASKSISALMKKYPWIETEKEAFGVSGGDYDFSADDAQSKSETLQSLQSAQADLAKKINKKVMGMIEKAEAEYNELIRKRDVVENDKKKIQSVIEELDVKKKSELERTWVKVNRDFGSIFSTLLPGAAAKLEPPEGMQAWEGLEVKVGFGDVWKESLSELSGGQRSLLALSLILSLLLFKPAPMYILDEVDAALDLSHTQNIGNMLKTHFSQSQFIVVSLKEGMFNNANVIFRTKFVDGVSTVRRTIGVGVSRGLGDANPNVNSSASSKRTARKRSAVSMGKEN